MSRTRQQLTSANPGLRTLRLQLERGASMADHAFGWGQFVYACSGIGRVETEAAQWVLPAARALWIPGGVRHVLKCTTRLDLRTLYFPPRRRLGLPRACTVVVVVPLLRELILRVVDLDAEQLIQPAQQRLVRVLVDELGRAPQEDLQLPFPSDPRARALAEAILDAPGSASLDQRIRGVGASRRTLERRFLAETGSSLGVWSRVARLHRSLALLGDGLPVQVVAERVGYASTSAFVAAFGRAFGRTPARYFA